MADSHANKPEIPISFSIQDLTKNNTYGSKSPSAEQHTFKFDNMGPEVLTDEVKDLMETHMEKYKDVSKIKMEQLEKKVFKELQCDNIQFHDKQQEIKDIMQNILKLQGHHENKPVSSLSSDNYDDEKQEIDKNSSFSSEERLVNLNKSDINKIKNTFNTSMNNLLSDTEDSKINVLKQQCSTASCMNDFKEEDNILEICPCLQRVCVFLKICHDFRGTLNQKDAVNLADYLIDDKYDAVALEEDFDHILLFHVGHKMQKIICNAIKSKYPCEEASECYHQFRHQKQPKTVTIENNKHKHNESLSPLVPEKSTSRNVVYSQLIDKIHCYFLHSEVSSGRHPGSSTDSEEMKSKYRGESEDKKWIKSIENIPMNDEMKVYQRLVKKMGVYRWQKIINSKKIQDWAHFKAHFRNVKEEALQNKYYPLSIDNWNQTVTKVMQFKKSFAAERMRTTRDGEYYDYVMKNKATWKSGETPGVKEITVIKLYTDWDELQSELKKCFRFMSADDIVQNYSPKIESRNSNEEMKKTSDKPKLSKLRLTKTTPSAQMLTMSKTSSVGHEEAVKKLRERTSQFFHWRASLLTFIHKFSDIILPTHNDKEFLLYHGVNKKMILEPSSTTSYWGPVSTSTSYYVAQTFATDKGMILALSSQYPRARYCTAFNASVISDYPEEQEYLIAHIYLRVRRVYTKSFQVLSMDSKLKFSFFVLHLFREEIFTMSPSLESFIIPFIQFYLMDVIQMNSDESKKEIEQQIAHDKKRNNNEEYNYLKSVYKCRKQQSVGMNDIPTAPGTLKIKNETEKTRKNRIFYIMIKTFKEIVEENKFLKLDCISPGLRPYFLKDSETTFKLMKRYNGLREEVEQTRYTVSFKKLIYLFPNVEQIVFLNYYTFDDDVLERLIHQIRRKENKLNCVKFLYYDYNDPLKDHIWFMDPKSLKQKFIKILKNEKWEIKSKQEKVGYSIKLKCVD